MANFYDYNQESPQMRITHHFGRSQNQPQRIVTELYGQQSPEMYRTLFQNQQQQQQQNWPNYGMDQWGNSNGYNNYNGMWQRPMNDFPRYPSAFQPQQQQSQQPFPFQAQNQPLNLQWTGEQNQQQQQQLPWYISQDPNNKAAAPVFQPHPTFSSNSLPNEPVYWVDNTAAKDSTGSDGFEKKEQINIPAVDEITEEPSEAVPVDDKWKVNAWQQTVSNTDNIVDSAVAPANAESAESTVIDGTANANKDSINANSVEEENTFLPIRTAQDKADDTPLSDDIRHSPFFQIDDPNSFKH